MRRTAVVNQIRSLLLERGLTLPKGRRYVDQQLPRILEDAELRLSGCFRILLAQLKLELEQLTIRIKEMDRVIQKTAKENEDCQRLTMCTMGGGSRSCGEGRNKNSRHSTNDFSTISARNQFDQPVNPKLETVACQTGSVTLISFGDGIRDVIDARSISCNCFLLLFVKSFAQC
jgi:hypothetical protein